MKAHVALIPFLLACGEDPPPAISFEEPGPLAGDAGKGSFRFGVATAATQIEDQNPTTDWYLWTQPASEGGLGNGEFVGDATRGYSKAMEDLGLVAELGLDSYRFSIEWARIEPVRDQIDEAAIAHYRAQLEAMRAMGIHPVVTLHHFSNPVWVADPRDAGCADGPSDTNLCGLGSAGGAMIVEEMAEHASLVALRFGDLVDEWGTLNEPVNYVLAAYGTGTFPPGRTDILSVSALLGAIRDYVSAHAAMYQAIKAADTVDADGDGVAAHVGLSISVAYWEAARRNQPSTHPDDLAAVDRINYVMHYLFVDAALHGTFDTNLDGISDEDHPEWAGTLDWLGLQYYFRAGVSADRAVLPEPLSLTPCFGGFDLGACLPAKDPTFCVPDMGYEGWAQGFATVMRAYADRYPALPLVVTEAGIASDVGRRRAENVVRVLEAIDEVRSAGADIRGYYHWSLTDNFEWAEGFRPRFGLYTVDYSTYARTATEGATVYAEIAKARELSSAQRESYGGTGPMTPDPGFTNELCVR